MIDPREIFEQYRTPQNVIKHCEKVTEVATKLALALKPKYPEIDIKAVEQAAAIHDALRVCDFRNFNPSDFPDISPEDLTIWLELRAKYGKMGHAAAMAEVLNTMNEPVLAKIVYKHDFARVEQLQTWEEKIVYYADKRVNNDQLMPLLQRLELGRQRNTEPGEERPERQEIVQKIVKLEQEFVDELGTLDSIIT